MKNIINFGKNLRVIKAELSFEWHWLAEHVADESDYYSESDIPRLTEQLCRWATKRNPQRWEIAIPAIAAGLVKMRGGTVQGWVNRLMAVETVDRPVEYDGLGGK